MIETNNVVERARKLVNPVVMVGDFDDDDDELEPTYPPPSKYNANQAVDMLADLIQSLSDRIDVQQKALVISVEALGRVNVRCFDRPSSPLKPLGDIARDALSAVAQTIGDEAYDEIASLTQGGKNV